MKKLGILLLTICLWISSFVQAEEPTYYVHVESEQELKAGTEILIIYKKEATRYWAFTAPENAHNPEAKNYSSSGYYCMATEFDANDVVEGNYIKIDRSANLAALWELTSDDCHRTYLKSVLHGGYLWTRNQYCNVSTETGEEVLQPVVATEGYRLVNFEDPTTSGEGLITLVNPKSSSYKFFRANSSVSAAWYFMTKNANCTTYVYRKVYALNYSNTPYVTLTNNTFRGDTAIVAAPEGASMASPSYAGYIDMNHFLGYTTTEGSSQVDYQPGDTIFLAKNNKNITLYPVYAFLKSYKTTFTTDEHSVCDVDSMRGFLPITMPEGTVDDGYYFLGWRVVGGDPTMIYAPGTVYPGEGSPLTTNVDFQAVTELVFNVVEWRNDTLLVEYAHYITGDSSYVEGGTNALPYGNTGLNTLKNTDKSGGPARLDTCLYRIILGTGSQKTSIANVGKKIRLKFFNGNTLVSHGTVVIPYFVGVSDKTLSASGFVKDVAMVNDLIIYGGATFTIDADDWAFQNIYVYAGSKLVVPEGKTLTIKGNLYVRSGYLHNRYAYGSDDSFFFRYPEVEIGGNIQILGKVYYEMVSSLEMGHMFNFATPADARIKEATYITSGDTLKLAHLSGDDVVDGETYVEYYDGAVRAQGLGVNATAWKDYYTLHQDVLKGGQGYTIMFEPRTCGTAPNAGQQRYTWVRIPMDANLSVAETEKLLPVNPYPAVKANNAGWNLVASPYMANYGGVNGCWKSNGIGIVEKKGAQYQWAGDLRYVVVPSDDGKVYTSQLARVTTLTAFKNFFVQVGTTDSTFLAFTLAETSPAPQMQNRVEEYMIGVTLSHNQAVDNMGILIGENYTAAYEPNADLSKMRTTKQLSVYALSSDEELAFVALNEDLASSTIPIGYVAQTSGQYTFSVDEQYDKSQFDALYLTDNLLHTTVNLLLEGYDFTTEKGQNNERFVLSCSLRKIPLAVDNTTTEEDIQVLPLVGGLTIANIPERACFQVYDVAGRLLITHEGASQTEQIPLPLGVYSIHVVSPTKDVVLRARVD